MFVFQFYVLQKGVFYTPSMSLATLLCVNGKAHCFAAMLLLYVALVLEFAYPFIIHGLPNSFGMKKDTSVKQILEISVPKAFWVLQ